MVFREASHVFVYSYEAYVEGLPVERTVVGGSGVTGMNTSKIPIFLLRCF